MMYELRLHLARRFTAVVSCTGTVLYYLTIRENCAGPCVRVLEMLEYGYRLEMEY